MRTKVELLKLLFWVVDALGTCLHTSIFNLKLGKDIIIRVTGSREVPALGVGKVGFLKNFLWIPVLSKDLWPESQLTIEDHLSINREPDAMEAIEAVSSGSIKSFFEP